MSEEKEKTGIKKILNNIIIGVVIFVITGMFAFVANQITSVYTFQEKYEIEKIKQTQKELTFDKELKELRKDYNKNLKINNDLQVEFTKVFKQNTIEHEELSNNINKLKYVIIKNNKDMQKDLELIKNYQLNDIVYYNVDTNKLRYIQKN